MLSQNVSAYIILLDFARFHSKWDVLVCIFTSVTPASSTALLVTQFLIVTNRIGEKWYHSAVLICISVIMSEVKELFINLKAATDRTKVWWLR